MIYRRQKRLQQQANCISIHLMGSDNIVDNGFENYLDKTGVLEDEGFNILNFPQPSILKRN
jgi:hypothetical protein